MTNPELTARRNDAVWSFEYQNRILAEARKAQAEELATAFGAAARWVAGVVKTAAGLVAASFRRAYALESLSRLSDRQLADIGLKRSDIPGYVLGHGNVAVGRLPVSGLKGWRPASNDASNDWTGHAAA